MKKLTLYSFLLLLSVLSFTACVNGPEGFFKSSQIRGAYIVNYGSYGNGGSSISKYDYKKGEFSNFYYQNQNEGYELLSNIQYACEFDGYIYMLGNNADELIIVNRLFEQSINGISDDFEKPRFCVGKGDYLYISCWGKDADWNLMPGSYIAKFNTSSNTVEGKIALPGGPEGLALVGNKIYAALNFKDSVAVIDIESEAISYIATPNTPSYLITDKDDNIYASIVSYYGGETGLARINTNTNELEKMYQLDGISAEYGSIITANKDFSKIYTVAAQYDANWNLVGGLYSFDVADETFTALASDISGPKGVSFNPYDEKIYLFTAESVTEGGSLIIYNEDGTEEEQFNTGISPIMGLFIK